MASWTTHSTPNTGSQSLLDMICLGAGTYVGVGGISGLVLTSSDSGVTWTSRTAAESNSWAGVASDGTTVVAVASAVTGTHWVMTSTDSGHTWTARTAAENNQWYAVCSPAVGTFVAVTISTGGGVHQVMKSTNSGTTWSTVAASASQNWNGVAANGSTLVAIANDGAGVVHVMTSADSGSTWTSQADIASFQTQILNGSNSIVYSSAAGKFVIAGYDFSTNKATFASSTNGVSWSKVVPNHGYFGCFGFAAAPAITGFIGSFPTNSSGGSTPTIVTQSTDEGATWTETDTTFSGFWGPAAWDNTNQVAVFWDINLSYKMLVGTFGTVTAVAPSHGPIAGGTLVTVTGTGFSGTPVVTFGGAAATAVNVVSATTLTCITAAHAAGLVDVSVGGATLTGGYTYITVTSIAPNSGTFAGGTFVTINGSGLSLCNGTVTLGGAPLTGVHIVSDTTITGTTSVHASGVVDVVIGGVGTLTGGYTYILPVNKMPPIPYNVPLVQ